MAFELEESAEVAVEAIMEECVVGGENGPEMKWIGMVAISTMIMALFSALGALMVGSTANEMLLSRTSEIIAEVKMENDRLEADIISVNVDLLTALGRDAEAKKLGEIKRDRDEMEELSAVVSEKESEAGEALEAHEKFGIGLTLLSVAVTLSGMALISRRRPVWYVALLIAVGGVVFVVMGFLLRFGP